MGFIHKVLQSEDNNAQVIRMDGITEKTQTISNMEDQNIITHKHYY